MHMCNKLSYKTYNTIVYTPPLLFPLGATRSLREVGRESRYLSKVTFNYFIIFTFTVIYNTFHSIVFTLNLHTKHSSQNTHLIITQPFHSFYFSVIEHQLTNVIL
jgi:hypothetical protein